MPFTRMPWGGAREIFAFVFMSELSCTMCCHSCCVIQSAEKLGKQGEMGTQAAEVSLVSPWPVAEGSWIHHLDITTLREGLSQLRQISRRSWCCCYGQIQKVIGVGRDSGGHSAQPPVKCFVFFVVNGWAVSPHWYVLREINNTLNVCGII